MPFAPKLKKEETATPMGAPNISGVSATINVPGQNAGASTKGAGSSGQYQNLQKYLAANQEQGTQMGQQVAQGVESKVSDVNKAVGNLSSQVQKTEKYDPYAAIQKAQEGTLSDEEKAQYQAQKQTGGYTGVKSASELGGYQDAFKAQEKAAADVAAAGTESGQQQLLKGTYNRPGYSAGQNKLDQVLLGQSAGGKAALEGLGQKYSKLTDQFNKSIGDIGSQIKSSQDIAAQNKAAFNPAEESAMSNILNPLDVRAKEQTAANKSLQDRFNAEMASGQLSPELIKQLVGDPNLKLYDLDLNKYFTQDQTQLGREDVATQAERDKYKKLTDLFGGQGDLLSQTAPTQTHEGVKFDVNAYRSDLAQKEQEIGKLHSEKGVGKYMSINPGSSSGLGLTSQLQNALDTMSLDEITQWYNSLPDTSRDASVAAKDSYQIKQLKEQIDMLNNKYSPNRTLGNMAGTKQPERTTTMVDTAGNVQEVPVSQIQNIKGGLKSPTGQAPLTPEAQQAINQAIADELAGQQVIKQTGLQSRKTNASKAYLPGEMIVSSGPDSTFIGEGASPYMGSVVTQAPNKKIKLMTKGGR